MNEETNNEMDLLLRRLSRREGIASPGDDGAPLDQQHLDADELSSYAENALPPSARARYTEHLADCSRCRTIVAQLSASLGAVPVQQVATPVVAASGLKKFLQSFFSPQVLRYAVPAIGLIAITAIGLLVFRQEPAGSLVSQQKRIDPQQEQVTNPAPTPGAMNDSAAPHRGFLGDTPAETSRVREGEGTAKTVEKNAGDSDSPKKEAAPDQVAVTVNEPKAYNQVSATPSPAKATGAVEVQREEIAQRRQQPAAAPAAAAPTDTELAKARAKTPAKEDDRKASDEVAAGPSKGQPSSGAKPGSASSVAGLRENNERNRDAGRDKAEARAESKRKDSAEVRSVAGRQFRREQNAWIDLAYNSQSTTNLTRGSEQFRALVADEPPIKTIADQLSGEVIVVWKGRAYRIR